MIRALRRRGPAALGAGLAAVLVAAPASGGDDGAASARGGGGDVVALEEGNMIQFKQQAQNFVDLGQYGGNDDRANFLPWKFAGGQSADGTKLIGLGTDVGSMGMCYRRDLLATAGMPTDRDAVGKLWP